jgi:hypothetical protein
LNAFLETGASNRQDRRSKIKDEIVEGKLKVSEVETLDFFFSLFILISWILSIPLDNRKSVNLKGRALLLGSYRGES